MGYTTDFYGCFSLNKKLTPARALFLRKFSSTRRMQRDIKELRVYFTRKSWNVETDGLIYTDKTFLRELKRALRTRGRFSKRAVDGIHYSEQGMQGGVGFQMDEDYVSFDASAAFAEEYRRRAVGRLP